MYARQSERWTKLTIGQREAQTSSSEQPRDIKYAMTMVALRLTPRTQCTSTPPRRADTVVTAAALDDSVVVTDVLVAFMTDDLAGEAHAAAPQAELAFESPLVIELEALASPLALLQVWLGVVGMVTPSVEDDTGRCDAINLLHCSKKRLIFW